MSRPPNSGASHGRSPSVDGEYRRASTHSLNLSYAYGAPASPRASASTSNGRPQSSPGRARSQISGSGSVRNGASGAGGEEAIAEEDDVEVETGRAAEPASVRYARIAQRKKDTGSAYLPAMGNTSVNIANAFKAATSGMGGVVTGGRREDFSAPLNDVGRDEDEEEEEEDEIDYVQPGPAKAAPAPQSAGKKRKKHAPKDPTFRHRAGDTSSSEESEYDQSHGKQKKRTKTGSEGDDLADDPASANKPRRKSTKPADPSYNPRRDPAYHAGQTSTSESDDGGYNKTHRRRKSKGKGRASTASTSAASMAIPRGIRDGEVWYGKKRKGRKGGRKSGANGEVDEEDDEEQDEGDSGEQQPDDLGGMDPQEHDYHGDDRFDEDDRDATPPATSFYLRPKSPSPAAASSTSQQQQQRNGWGFASSFRFGGASTSASTSAAQAPPVDPAFSAFDRSLGQHGDEHSISGSLDDSAIRGSSYDFSEEEAIVRLLEENHRAKQMKDKELKPPSPTPPTSHEPPSRSPSPPPQIRQQQQQQQQSQPQPPPTPGPSVPRQAALAATPALRHLQQQQPAAHSPNPSLLATPVPYSGAYPNTPAPNGGAGGAGFGSPVSSMRRRQGQGVPVPSMLGAGTTLGARDDDDEEEEGDSLDGETSTGSARRRGNKRGGVGEKLGAALKPLVEVFARLWAKTQDPLLDWVKIWKAVFVLSIALFALLAYLAPSVTEPPVPVLPSHTRSSSILDYLPFLRSSKSSSAYLPPNVPADSLEGLIARLSHLEGVVGTISSAKTSDREQHSHDRQAVGDLATQLEVLQKTLAAEQKRARLALDGAHQAHAKEVAGVSKTVQSVKGELDALVSRVKSLSQDREADASELKKLQGSIDGVGRDLVALDKQVQKVARDLLTAADEERIMKIALEAIGKKLPGKMAARIDPSGRLNIDPAFWRHLKGAFAEKKDVDAKLAALQASSKSSSAKDSKAPPPPPAPAAPPSWDDFLAANEESLKAWVASDLSSRSGSDAFLSKQQFLDLLRREIKTLKREFNDKANDNFESMGQELLRKVAEQEKLRQKDQHKDSLASHLNPFHRKHDSPPSPSGPVELKSADGQNVTAIISSLVDSALIRYSKDVLARPDYALYTAGGRVIRSLTSQTYEPHPVSAARSVLAWITGTNAPRGRPPVTALHPDTAPGSCWPFAGPTGQLGIQLSRRVVPSDISIEHISPDVALDGDVSSAPREFEVWGIVEAQEDVVRLAQHRKEQLEAKRAARAADPAAALNDDLNNPDGSGSGGHVASLPPSANHLLLAVGAYDPSLPSPVQSFPVTSTARQLGIPVNVVVLKVLSNHGEEAYTCLYRVRVSGTTEAQALDAAAGGA
ncbi:hypothetical protein JCM8097_008650 [Rhodosporidiobolus ruineniae]